MIAIVRIRGLKHVRPDIRKALDTLNLDRKNHCVVVSLDEKDQMLMKVRDYTAYGKVTNDVLAKLIQKRGRMEGDKPVSVDVLKKNKINSYADLATALDGKKTTLETMGIKRVFRLNSPKKGYGKIGMKKPTELKGPLGFHPEGMDELLSQMM